MELESQKKIDNCHPFDSVIAYLHSKNHPTIALETALNSMSFSKLELVNSILPKIRMSPKGGLVMKWANPFMTLTIMIYKNNIYAKRKTISTIRYMDEYDDSLSPELKDMFTEFHSNIRGAV